MGGDSELHAQAVLEYRRQPLIKRVPIVACYFIDKTIERVPAGARTAIAYGCSVLSVGHLALCAAVPFVYVYQRDKNMGDSILSTE